MLPVTAVFFVMIGVKISDSYGWPGKRTPRGAVTASADRCPNRLLPGSGLQLLGVQFSQPGAAGMTMAD